MGPLLVTNGVTCGPQKNHETFLDTQVTVSISGSNRLGVDADWSDGKTLYIKVHPKNAVAVASLKDAGKWEVIASGCFFFIWAGLGRSKRATVTVVDVQKIGSGSLEDRGFQNWNLRLNSSEKEQVAEVQSDIRCVPESWEWSVLMWT